jgi:hypothetical protein
MLNFKQISDFDEVCPSAVFCLNLPNTKYRRRDGNCGSRLSHYRIFFYPILDRDSVQVVIRWQNTNPNSCLICNHDTLSSFRWCELCYTTSQFVLYLSRICSHPAALAGVKVWRSPQKSHVTPSVIWWLTRLPRLILPNLEKLKYL